MEKIYLQQIKRSSVAIAALFLLIKSLGFIEKLVLANYFGTSDTVDAYLIAYSVPFTFYIIFEEILNPVLVPYFVKIFSKGNFELGIKLFQYFAVGLLFIWLGISFFGYIKAESIVKQIAPGFSGEKQLLTIQLLRNLFVIFIFLGFSNFLTTIFYTYKQFNIPVLARSIPKLFIVFGILFLHKRYGIHSAVIGCIAGSFLQAGLLFIFLPIRPKQYIIQQTVKIPKNELKHIIILMLPLFVGVLFSQISSLIDQLVASRLGTGTIASLSYARKIIDFPILIVPYAMGIVLLPYLSALNSKKDQTEFFLIFDQCFKILFSLFAFMTVYIVIFNTEIVRILFERGQFDTTSTEMTSAALFFFAFGLVAFAIEIPIMQAYFALGNTWTPIWVGMCCVVLNITITLTLVYYLGFIIIPLALSFQKIVKNVWLFLRLKRNVVFNIKETGLFVLKVIGCSAITVFILFLIQYSFFNELERGFTDLIIYFGICSVIAFIIYVSLLLFFHVMVFDDMKRIMNRRQLRLIFNGRGK